MNDLYLSDVNNIIQFISHNQGSSIAQISANTGINRQLVRKFIINIYRSPFGGIFIYFVGYSDKEDIESINIEILDNVLKWHIDTTRMNKVPVEMLTAKEMTILISLLKSTQNSKIQSISHRLLNAVEEDTYIFMKKPSVHSDDLFQFEYYQTVKNAIIKCRMIRILYQNKEQKFDLLLKPLGWLFEPSNGFWYLIAQNDEDKIFPYKVNRIKIVTLLPDIFEKPEGFNLNYYAENVWGMEMNSIESVKILFKNEGNVVAKCKEKLQGNGKIKILENGSLLFEGEIKGIQSFTSWLRGLGSSVKIIYPEWLKQDIIKSYKKVIENYKNINQYQELVNQIK